MFKLFLILFFFACNTKKGYENKTIISESKKVILIKKLILNDNDTVFLISKNEEDFFLILKNDTINLSPQIPDTFRYNIFDELIEIPNSNSFLVSFGIQKQIEYYYFIKKNTVYP